MIFRVGEPNLRPLSYKVAIWYYFSETTVELTFTSWILFLIQLGPGDVSFCSLIKYLLLFIIYYYLPRIAFSGSSSIRLKFLGTISIENVFDKCLYKRSIIFFFINTMDENVS